MQYRTILNVLLDWSIILLILFVTLVLPRIIESTF